MGIPVIDLFAGPGGLAEGFSSLTSDNGDRIFNVRVSIEKDPCAHRTLSLRSFFRGFPQGKAPDCYYDYIRGNISLSELLSHPSVATEARASYYEPKLAVLGDQPPKDVNQWIHEAIGNTNIWVLIGGPPCQAYSIAGRSRMRGTDPEAFEADKRHLLYQEYLRIISKFSPPVFVMENVKGILTSMHKGSLIFDRIRRDLSDPGNGLKYDIRSFVTSGNGDCIGPEDFVIKSEDFGVPQTRHRVILFGIRSDLAGLGHERLVPMINRVTVQQVISDLKPLRSKLSGFDTFEWWLDALETAPHKLKGWQMARKGEIKKCMRDAWSKAHAHASTGGRFIPGQSALRCALPEPLRAWCHDPRLGGTSLHETRSHMPSDVQRYLFAACYAAEVGHSPKLTHFPDQLLPNHSNVDEKDMPFPDRFRVQIETQPASTVVSHIAKDGHYYIHPDPSQCRSLTVREAARLQTFPDNYFFEGNRTQQYAQVGNAVPPYLARQIAEAVSQFLQRAATYSRHNGLKETRLRTPLIQSMRGSVAQS